MTDHPATQPDLFDVPMPAPERAFDGATYEPKRDYERLNGQLGRVYRLMCDGHWRTLSDIRHVVGGSDASVSARLRDLRKAKYGARTVERRHVRDGCFEYRLIDAGQRDTGPTCGGSPQTHRRNQAPVERRQS